MKICILRMRVECLYRSTIIVTPAYLVDPRTETMTRGEYLFERVNEWLEEWLGTGYGDKVFPERWNDGRYRSETLPPRHSPWKPWNRIRTNVSCSTIKEHKV